MSNIVLSNLSHSADWDPCLGGQAAGEVLVVVDVAVVVVDAVAAESGVGGRLRLTGRVATLPWQTLAVITATSCVPETSGSDHTESHCIIITNTSLHCH